MVPERHPPEAPADGEDSEHSEDDAWPDAQEDPADCESDADDEPEIVAPCSLMLPSLFRGRAPTVWFEYAAFVGKVRSAERQRIFKHVPGVGRADDALKFRSNHTITCLCGAFKRSGFKRLLKGNSYNVFWGHHLKEHQLQKLDMRQLVNHFPGSYGLGRKDYLWRNISRMARRHSGAYDFCAKSYVLPRDRELLERDFADGEVYIVKPPGSAEGRGIRLVNRPDGLPRPGQPAVVQHYIPNPYLINGKKFDLRIYVGVTSFDPLRAYIFDEGLVRFATADYAGLEPPSRCPPPHPSPGPVRTPASTQVATSRFATALCT